MQSARRGDRIGTPPPSGSQNLCGTSHKGGTHACRGQRSRHILPAAPPPGWAANWVRRWRKRKFPTPRRAACRWVRRCRKKKCPTPRRCGRCPSRCLSRKEDGHGWRRNPRTRTSRASSWKPETTRVHEEGARGGCTGA